MCWYRDENNDLLFLEEPAPYYCYRRNETNFTHKSLFGDNLSKQVFENRNDYNKYVKKRSNLFESDISPVYKFLSDTFYEIKDTTLNVAFFDIEVDYDLSNGDGYPIPENPFGMINSFSLYDTRTKEYHLIMLHEDVQIDIPEGEKVNLYHCVTERHLLDTFFKVIKDIDVLSAWNGDKYDIGYIVERCIEVYGEKEGLKKLCRNGYKIKSYVKQDDYGNDYIHYTLVGRIHLDYMEVYKKFTFGERDSYALNSIVEHELGENKLEYRGDLGDLYRSDPKTFFEYSLHDSRLMKLLDDKLRFIKLATQMAKQATIKLTDVLGSIRYLEHSIMNYCHFDRAEKIILPDKNPDNKKEKFPGAFVLIPTPDAYGWVSSIDLASLYPSVIRSINISPETHVLQCKNDRDDFTKIVEQSEEEITMTHIESGDQISMPAFEVYDLLREMNYTISAYGSIFSDEIGLIPEILGIWYSQRKALKKKSKQYYESGDKANGDYYDMLQNINKLGLNSLYGVVSNRFSRFYSIALAASVTTTGQIIEKFQMWKADQIMKEKIGE